MHRRLAYFVLYALLLGIVAGCLLHTFPPDAATAAALSGCLTIITGSFLRLIKLIIAPLVFTALVSGIARMEGSKTVGRIGAKTAPVAMTVCCAWTRFEYDPVSSRNSQ